MSEIKRSHKRAQRAEKREVVVKVGTFAAWLSALLVMSAWSPAISQTALPPAPAFHHLHLNSVDPYVAIAFYARQFATTSNSSGGGLRALRSPTNGLCSVQQGRDSARHPAADCDLAFRLARGRFAQDP